MMSSDGSGMQQNEPCLVATAVRDRMQLGFADCHESPLRRTVRWWNDRPLDPDGRRELDWADRFFARWDTPPCCRPLPA